MKGRIGESGDISAVTVPTDTISFGSVWILTSFLANLAVMLERERSKSFCRARDLFRVSIVSTDWMSCTFS